MLASMGIWFTLGVEMIDQYEIKKLLGQMIQAFELLTDETAELVDHYQRQRVAKEFHQDVIDRVNALTATAQALRQAGETFLGETYLPAKSGKEDSK